MHIYCCKKCGGDTIKAKSVSIFHPKSGTWKHLSASNEYYCIECEKKVDIISRAIIHYKFLAFSDDLFYEIISNLNLHELTCHVGGRHGFPNLLEVIISILPEKLEMKGHRIFISGSDPFWKNTIKSRANAVEKMKNRLKPIIKAIKFDQAISGEIP